MARADEDDVGATPQRLRRAHRGADAEAAGDVVRRGDDAAALRVATDDERLGAERRVLELLNSREDRRGRDRRVSAPRERYGAAVLTAPPPPPAIEQPAAYQLSYGVVAGTAAPGTRRVIVRVGSRTLADKPLAQRHFQLRVALPPSEAAVEVITVNARGRRSRATVPHVLGAGGAASPVLRAPRDDALLQRTVHQLAQRFGSTSGIYVQDLTTGAGAAWNARATFPAASSLKLAIAVTALARLEGTPLPGSTLDRLLRTMLTYSDNAAANSTEAYFGGSTSGGSALVNSLMRSVGLVDTEMYGGYELDAFGEPRRSPAGSGAIPLRVDYQPSWGIGKRSSAYDLATLLRGVWFAGGGHGPLHTARPGFSLPMRAICSICSRTSATPASSTARSGGSPACACSTRRGRSTARGTTTGSCSGRAERSSSR